jgi:hypothetical protein
VTWLRQVPHVMWKDARQMRWPLAAYAVVVLFAWVQALRPVAALGDVYDFSMFLVVLTGMYIAGLFVHADSPTRVDSFWATRSLHPVGVLTSKATSAFVLLVVPPLLAQLHVLVISGLAAPSILSMLGRSVWLYAIWLIVAMVIAGLTLDTRSFTLGLLLIPAALALMATIGSIMGLVDPSPPVPRVLTFASVLGIPGLVLAAMWLVLLYRTRSLGFGGRVASLFAIVGSLYAVAVRLPGSARHEAVVVRERNDRVVQILGAGIRPGATVWVQALDSANRLVVLESGELVFRLRGGSTLRAPIQRSRLQLAVPPIPVDGARWISEPPFQRRSSVETVPLTREQEDSLQVGVESAFIDGYVASYEPVVGFSLPFQANARQRRDGSSVLILSANAARGDSVATLAFSIIENADTLDAPPRPHDPSFEKPRFALLNPTRRQAVVLQQGASSGSNEALVLPGAWRMSLTASVQLRPTSSDSIPDGWANGARLMVIDWIRRGRSRVQINLSVRQPGDGA